MWWQNVLGLAVGGSVGALAAVITAMIGRRTTRETTQDTTALGLVSHLNQRMQHLEDRVGELETALGTAQRLIRAAATFIDRVGLWLDGGQTAPRPNPPALLHEQIDTSLWSHDRGPTPGKEPADA
jgi:hypothetical protein